MGGGSSASARGSVSGDLCSAGAGSGIHLGRLCCGLYRYCIEFYLGAGCNRVVAVALDTFILLNKLKLQLVLKFER